MSNVGVQLGLDIEHFKPGFACIFQVRWICLNVWFTLRIFLGGRHDLFLIKVSSLKSHSGRKLNCSNILLIWNVNGCFDSGFVITLRENLQPLQQPHNYHQMELNLGDGDSCVYRASIAI